MERNAIVSHLLPLPFSLARVADAPLPPVRLANFGIPDTLFIVVLALIVFGPKKLPEISRQVGKLLYEFRKASNDFKFQIEEELRSAEQAERQKELSAQAATSQPATPIAITAGETVSAEPAIEGVRAPRLRLRLPLTERPESSTAETRVRKHPGANHPAAGQWTAGQYPLALSRSRKHEGATQVTAAGSNAGSTSCRRRANRRHEN